MKDIVKTALISFASLAFIVALLEVFLDEGRKNQINTRFLRYWNALDDLKKRRVLDWVQARRRWFLGIGLLLAAAFVLKSEFDISRRTGKIGFAEVILSALMFGPGLWFGFALSGWTLRATTLFIAVVRSTVFVACTFVPLYLLEAVEKQFVLPIMPSLTAPNPTPAIAIVKLLIVCATSVAMFFSFFNIIFWLPVAIPLIVIYVASIFIFVAEFVMRKLAEYPRGAVVAIALILAALVTLLRALG